MNAGSDPTTRDTIVAMCASRRSSSRWHAFAVALAPDSHFGPAPLRMSNGLAAIPHDPRFASHACAWARRVALGSLAILFGLVSSTGQEAVKSFDLPADILERAIKRFAVQAGVSVLIPGDEAPTTLRTRPVHGEKTPAQALDEMLAGTDFTALADPRNGAFAVFRRRDAKPPPRWAGGQSVEPLSAPRREPLAGGRSSDSIPTQPPTPGIMKSRNPIAALAAWFALTLSPAEGVQAAESGSESAAAHGGVIEGRVMNEVTGRYLNNAMVRIKGTDLRTFTDEAGRFRITNVPGGPAVLEVVYSGLPTAEAAVEVRGDATVSRDVLLSPTDGSAIKLDPYRVASSRYMDEAALAINEQRFAPNLKTVVPTGDLADHGDGNIAEFLKFVPGISGDHGQRGEIGELSVRGFPSEMTQISYDGADVANAPLNGNDRTVSLSSTMSITNLARIEVTKVPTPATGADTMAGSVNLISRSAFESPRRVFRYSASIAGEHDNVFNLIRGRKTWGVFEPHKTYNAWPTFTFSYTDPLTPKFGYSISGKYYTRGLTTHERSRTFNFNSATFGSSPENPLYTSHFDNWWGQLQHRRHLDSSADWRVTPNSVLSFGFRVFSSERENGIYRVQPNVGTNATPTPATGIRGSHGPDFSHGATGRGTIQFQNNNQVQLYGGTSGNLRYNFDNGDWRIDLKTSRSAGKFRYRTLPSRGHMRNVTVRSTIPLRLQLNDIVPVDGPREILAFDNANQPVDVTSRAFIENFTEVASATTLTFDVTDDVETYQADVRKNLDRFRVPAAVQMGAARKTRERDTWNRNEFLFEGYNGPNGTRSPAPFIAGPFELYPGDDGNPWHVISPYLTASAFNNDPNLFYELPAARIQRERTRIGRSENIKEEVEALYFQAEARFFESRLTALTGVRYERTNVRGRGALATPGAIWLRNPDGSFVTNASGSRVRDPAAGAPGSMEELAVTLHERAAHSDRSYDGFYPSFHVLYNLTEKFQARAAYAKTYGRPNFTFIIPSITVNEDLDQNGNLTGGRLDMRNPGLLPWEADNYDLTLEYYTNQGGVVSAGIFRKDVSRFFSDVIRPSTPGELAEAGVDAQGEEWETQTTVNLGDARVHGFELSFNQSLAPLDRWLAGWGRSFRVFGNVTKIRIAGARQADFRGFLPMSANWGVQFARQRFSASVRWNHTDDRPTAVVTNLGPNGEQYTEALTQMDVNLRYSFLPNHAIFVDLKNVTQEFRIQAHRSDVLPSYAEARNPSRLHGVAMEIGITGRF